MNQIKLYECADDVVKLLDMLEEENTDITADTIEMVIGDFQEKAVSVAGYVLNLGAQIKMLDEHIKAITAKKQTLVHKETSIKNYLSVQMKRTGIKQISANDGTFTAKFVKNPAKVIIYDETMIPKEFLREKITIEPDKFAIKRALQNDQEIQGATLKQEESLRIK